MGRLSLAVRRSLSALAFILLGFCANAQCDGCNLNFDGDQTVTRYSTHRYTVTNYDTDHPYGEWVVFNCEIVDDGIDVDGEPYIDVYFDGDYGAVITYGDAGPGWYQYGEYEIMVNP